MFSNIYIELCYFQYILLMMMDAGLALLSKIPVLILMNLDWRV